ncbi:uncharacterized protein K489DRAFT_233080 [Dissoconium aciculare CBS 342.82]|uniref:Uncharacterized protein n=1 Tax=Dissoconium aciculare CBS 342.82 TaxID=1314786 RepID=A0A6J3M2H0_9PEZI|nr:uncharacterized protein K489DRAFT_233080 [Dissoconium aciculare CBS 342.82]KAF1822103.1 hypothetical protein K489DRAFT_233080 [Dissoconium aciculare CBS 342.82]
MIDVILYTNRSPDSHRERIFKIVFIPGCAGGVATLVSIVPLIVTIWVSPCYSENPADARIRFGSFQGCHRIVSRYTAYHDLHRYVPPPPNRRGEPVSMCSRAQDVFVFPALIRIATILPRALNIISAMVSQISQTPTTVLRKGMVARGT